MPISYILIAESCGIGFVIEINSELEYSKERLVRYFDLNFNSTENDIINEFQFLAKFRINELKPLNIQPEFMQSNGFDFLYLIEIKRDLDLNQFIDEWTRNREISFTASLQQLKHFKDN